MDRSFLWWLNGTFRKGCYTVLSLRDLHVLDASLSSDNLSEMATIAWAKRRQPERHWEFPLVICKAMWKQLVWIIVPRLLLVGVTFAQPFLIKKILSILAPSVHEASKLGSRNLLQGIIMTAATIFVFVGLAVLRLHYSQELNRFKTMFRGAAVSVIYSHSLQTPDGVNDDSAAVTLMSTDVDQIAGCLTQINELWARSIEVTVGITLLARELGYLSSVPILLVFGMFAFYVNLMNALFDTNSIFLGYTPYFTTHSWTTENMVQCHSEASCPHEFHSGKYSQCQDDGPGPSAH